ncbi:hypothetical protein NDU88_004266 [Pleurodeles waltl]|uniref:Uncharacterized protein n=1 Tax=Pleurodeles waltl TaxID=8319 RepID=A0AAV7UG08_PLEWA|nr:hypothetical protein NDU88_004266 [Pleurodeles waltl]
MQPPNRPPELSRGRQQSQRLPSSTRAISIRAHGELPGPDPPTWSRPPRVRPGRSPVHQRVTEDSGQLLEGLHTP